MILLIVDDETNIREGLSAVDWHSIGMTNVLCAKNGLEAQRIIDTSLPDIVLTDIRMPGMDGLELADYINQVYPDIKTILISGYSDFDYAKKAISIGVEDYLLKPVNIDGLLNKVGSIIKEKKEKHIINKQLDQKQCQIDSVIYSIIEDQQKPQTNIDAALINYGVDWSSDYIACISFEITSKNYDSLSTVYFNDIKKNIIHGFTSYEKSCIQFSNPIIQNELSVFLNFSSTAQSKALAEDISKITVQLEPISNKYSVFITISISKIYGKHDFRRAYLDARDTLKHKFFLGQGIIIFSARMNREQEVTPKSYASIESKLKIALDTLDINQCLAILRSLFRDYYFSSPQYISEIKENFYKLVKLLSNRIHGKVSSDKNFLCMGYLPYADKFETLDEYIKHVEMLYCEMIDILKVNKPSKSTWIIEKAKEYIHENYHMELSVDDVAIYVERNPNYFSHLFAQIEGVPFTEYLNQYRVSLAKNLLVNSSLMSYEVADKVGFNNYRYFTQVFKKMTGMSPTQYRDTYYKDQQ